MEHDKHLHGTDGNRLNNEDDQLRDNTMNETIREAQGSADANISNLSDGSGQLGNTGRSGDDDRDLYGSDTTQGVSLNPNDASAVRSGGTTDMDDQTAGGAGLAGERLGGGTSVTTKHGVTGSDFDGQSATS